MMAQTKFMRRYFFQNTFRKSLIINGLKFYWGGLKFNYLIFNMLQCHF